MHRAIGLVFLPGRTGEIAPNDAFDGQHFGLAAQHDAALPVVTLSRGRAVVERGREEMAAHHALELLEPEGRHGREHAALVGNGFGHHNVEGAQAIGGDHEQSVIARVVNIANFS